MCRYFEYNFAYLYINLWSSSINKIFFFVFLHILFIIVITVFHVLLSPYNGELSPCCNVCSFSDDYLKERRMQHLYFHDIFFVFLLILFYYPLDKLLQVTESDAVDVLEACLSSHSSDTATRSMSLIALLKLSSRFPPTSEYAIHLMIFIPSIYHFYKLEWGAFDQPGWNLLATPGSYAEKYLWMFIYPYSNLRSSYKIISV